MAAARRRSTVQINPRLQRLLRRLPEDCTQELKTEIREAAELVRYEALKRVPVDTGDLAQSLGLRIGSRGLSAEVGYADKPGFRRNWDRAGWRARFIEFGTKGYVPGKTKRAMRGAAKRVIAYVAPRPARPFLRPAYQAALQVIRPRLNAALARALDMAGR